MSRSCSASVATVRRGTRLRTGSPSGVGVTSRSSRSRSMGRCSSGDLVVDLLGRLGDRALIPPVRW